MHYMGKGKNIVMSKNVSSSGGHRMKNHDTIDRSKIRILLCDTNAENCEQVSTLLCQCSYQVTSVWAAAEVIGALNAEGPQIDIILAEVGLLLANDVWMLKYIMGDKELQHIPVIMLLTQDEVSAIAKCLRFGTTDYLVKPLCSNELLNLSRHVGRGK